MAGAVMQPLARDGGMRAKWRDGASMKKVAAGFIKPNDRLTSFERLEIYNRQYWYRLKDCFYDDYPGLRALLGPDRFEKLACAYLTSHPSKSFTLRNLGSRLLGFLQAEPKWIAGCREAAMEVARLEWAHIEAFDNEALPPLDTDSLLGVDPSSIRLRLQPHLGLLQLRYEADQFLIKAKKNETEREDASNAKRGSVSAGSVRAARAPKRLKREIFLAVHRHDHSVYYKRLEQAQFRLLSSFQAGSTVAEACQDLAASTLTDVSKIQSWFQSWAALGWFCAFK